jgi:isoleucyl-tRNA synthetase
MVDADREKISKSKQGPGGYEKPQTSESYVNKHGADVVRLWVTSQDFRTDIVVSEDRLGKVSETYRMLRNTLRYQLSNLFDFDPAQHRVPDEKLTWLDRWILHEFTKLQSAVLAAYQDSEFHGIYQRVSQFAAVELSAIYHDVVKDRLYTDAAHSPRRRSTQTALHRLVRGLCRMLSPVLVFTADEAWEFVPGRETASVHEARWEVEPLSATDQDVQRWQALFALRGRGLMELEKARQNKVIGKALEAQLRFAGPAAELHSIAGHEEELRELLNVSALSLQPGTGEQVSVSLARADGLKCERCWHWETTVGSHPAHPALCGRCVDAIGAKAG